jgi:triphosphoribosyl-dephospho-CoA synthetase
LRGLQQQGTSASISSIISLAEGDSDELQSLKLKINKTQEQLQHTLAELQHQKQVNTELLQWMHQISPKVGLPLPASVAAASSTTSDTAVQSIAPGFPAIEALGGGQENAHLDKPDGDILSSNQCEDHTAVCLYVSKFYA